MLFQGSSVTKSVEYWSCKLLHLGKKPFLGTGKKKRRKEALQMIYDKYGEKIRNRVRHVDRQGNCSQIWDVSSL